MVGRYSNDVYVNLLATVFLIKDVIGTTRQIANGRKKVGERMGIPENCAISRVVSNCFDIPIKLDRLLDNPAKNDGKSESRKCGVVRKDPLGVLWHGEHALIVGTGLLERITGDWPAEATQTQGVNLKNSA